MYTDLCNNLKRAATGVEIEHKFGISVGVYLIRFGTMSNLAELAGYEPTKKSSFKYSKELIAELLIKEVKRKGIRLTVKEIKNLSSEFFPSYTTILRYFHTTKIINVWEEIGV